ncbi:hypothetical protein ACKGJN_04485 [Gillisia sp. Q332]|uniref:hypothetical protein n=1 Tax=Gillisia xinjiangensis TaxID=3384765 RepID=UPI00391B60C6
MSNILHTGGKALKTAVALKVGKAILTKHVILYSIGLAGIGVLAAAGTGYLVYSLATRKKRKPKKRKTS